ncbi:MAG TPA: hypothetical protein VF941_01900 [Clostridia bacterium]
MIYNIGKINIRKMSNEEGIAVAGNMLVDTIYPIDHYLKAGDAFCSGVALNR